MVSRRPARILRLLAILQLILMSAVLLDDQALGAERSAQCVAQIPPPIHVNSLIQASISQPAADAGKVSESK